MSLDDRRSSGRHVRIALDDGRVTTLLASEALAREVDGRQTTLCWYDEREGLARVHHREDQVVYPNAHIVVGMAD